MGTWLGTGVGFSEGWLVGTGMGPNEGIGEGSSVTVGAGVLGDGFGVG